VGENAKKLHDNFQPYASINNADFGCHIEHIHVDLFHPCTFTSRADLLYSYDSTCYMSFNADFSQLLG
jgi:hypothetical protein